MAQFLGSPRVQYFKSGTADFLEDGKLYSYVAGTLTPKATYPTIADALALTNPNANPVVMDARGEASVVISGSTKLILKDADGATLWTVDGVDSGGNDILDDNGNEILKFVGVPSAVNEVTITNAATSQAPSISASGGDVNTGLKVTSKGSGILLLDGGSTGTVDVGTTSTGGINLKRATNASVSLTTPALTATTSFTTSDTTLISIMPAGIVSWFAGTTVPTGYLECTGAAVSRTTYSALFTAIGTTYGVGDGSTTFNLPTQARNVLVGRGGSGSGTLGSTVGSTGGTETVTIAAANLPSNMIKGSVSVLGSAAGAQTVPDASALTANPGGGTAINNLQPSLVMMMIIRAY